MGKIAWKVLAAVAGIAATKAATAAANGGWKAATGKKAPQGKHDERVSSTEAAIFAILSTAAVAGAKIFAERKAADYYTKSAGHPPKDVQKAQKKDKQKQSELVQA